MSPLNNLLQLQDSKFLENSRLVQNMANEWRQPISQLSAQILYLQTLQELGNDTQVAKELLKMLPHLNDSIQKMRSTLNLFSNFYETKSGKCFCADIEIENITSMFQQQIILKNINLDVECTPNLELCECKNTFLNVLMILFQNAVEAIPEGKKDAKIKIRLHKDDGVILQVSDNGETIAKEDEKKLFNQSFSTKDEASGLGLIVAKEMVTHRLGGKLHFEQKGDFKTFLVTF